MRVDAAAIVAIDQTVAAVHASLLGAGCSLAPLAHGWFIAAGVMRVRLVWRNRLQRISHVTTLTLRAAELGRAL
jgi:hypothetical protein